MHSRFVRVAACAVCVAMLAGVVAVGMRIFSHGGGPDGRDGGQVALNRAGNDVTNTPAPLTDDLSASQRPYDGSNVYVRLSSGVIVRQGEILPPLAEEDKKDKKSQKALEEWERLSKTCSGGVRANRRKVSYAEFAKALRRIPKERRSENLKYAINMMDDSHFLIIAALALDRNQPNDLIALAFDACLNRDTPESRAVIEEISKDKSHPMYVDAARVMDVKRLAGGATPNVSNSRK